MNNTIVKTIKEKDMSKYQKYKTLHPENSHNNRMWFQRTN